jgi:hypothetical protein
VYVIQHNRNPFVDHPGVRRDDLGYQLGVAGVADPPARDRLVLRQNQPNPFAASTSIRFDLPRRAAVSLAVYDIGGREVRSLVGGAALEPGSHAIAWDGRDAAGAPLRAGIYFCRLRAGGGAETKRMVLTR